MRSRLCVVVHTAGQQMLERKNCAARSRKVEDLGNIYRYSATIHRRTLRAARVHVRIAVGVFCRMRALIRALQTDTSLMLFMCWVRFSEGGSGRSRRALYGQLERAPAGGLSFPHAVLLQHQAESNPKVSANINPKTARPKSVLDFCVPIELGVFIRDADMLLSEVSEVTCLS